MFKVVSRNCPNCGAALHVNPRGQQPYNVTCSYCKTVVTIVPFEARQPTAFGMSQVPVGPNIILLDATAGIGATRNAYKDTYKAVYVYIVMTVVLPAVIMVLYNVGGLCISYVNSRFNVQPSPNVNSRFNLQPFPIDCSMAEEVVIRGRKATLTEPFVNADSFCKVRIIDSQLTGSVIVKAGANITVTVENSVLRVTKAVMEGNVGSTLKLTRGSKVYTDAVVASGSSHVTVELTGSSIESKGSIVKAPYSGVVKVTEKSRVSVVKPVIDGSHAEITLDDSELMVGSSILPDESNSFKITASNQSLIRSDGVALVGGSLGSLDLSDSQLIGKNGAIDVGMNNVLTVTDGASIQSPQDAVRMGIHSRVTVGQGAKIESGKTAVRVGSNSYIQVTGGTIAGANSITADDFTTVKLRNATIHGARSITGMFSNVLEE